MDAVEQDRLASGPPDPLRDHRRGHVRELGQQRPDLRLDRVHNRPSPPADTRAARHWSTPSSPCSARSLTAARWPGSPYPPPAAADGSLPSPPRSAPPDLQKAVKIQPEQPDQLSPGADTLNHIDGSRLYGLKTCVTDRYHDLGDTRGGWLVSSRLKHALQSSPVVGGRPS
jgi:hypothetical protein